MLDNQTKACTKCGVEKSLTEFTKEKTGRLGRRSKCKPCYSAHVLELSKNKRENTPQNAVKCCTRCGEIKAISDFPKGVGLYGRAYACGTCRQISEAARKSKLTLEQIAKKKETQATWRLANRDTVNSKKRREATGFNREHTNTAKAVQNNQCAICGVDFSSISPKAMHADHDHVTGEKRGLLCSHCNTGIGRFNDSHILLRRAAEYLENPPLRGVL